MSAQGGMAAALSAACNRHKWLSTVAMLSPVLICLVIMLPRLSEARFGLFDDSETLQVSGEIVGGNWSIAAEASRGRFRPVYWINSALVYAVGGSSPFVFFAANTLAFMCITGLLVSLIRLHGGSRLQAWAAGFLFALSGPTIESFYTLSKAEPPQVLLLLLSLWCIGLSTRLHSRLAKAVALVLAGLLVLLAMGCKETTLVVIPVSIIWFAVNGGSTRKGEKARALGGYGIATVLAGGIYLGVRLAFGTASPAAGTYSDEFVISTGRIVASSVRWAGWLLRDFPYLWVLLILWIYRLATRRKSESTPLLVGSLIWMAGWLLVFLPWAYTLEYYALPFGAGSSAFSGVILGEVLVGKSVGRPFERLGVAACLAVVLVSLGATGANNVTSARLQLAVDAANAEMVDYLAASVPRNGTVTVNLPAELEYVQEIGPLLSEWKDRGDIAVSSFSFQTAAEMPDSVTSYLVAAPYIINQPPLSVRLGVDEVGCRRWNEALRGFLGQEASPVASVGRQFALSNVEFIRLLCKVIPFGHYCSTSGPLVDTRPLSYGWDIYEVNLDQRSTARPAVFRPGGIWAMQRADGSVVEVSFGQAGDIPVVGDWDGDGHSDLGFFRPADQTWGLDTDDDREAEIELRFVGMTPGDVPLVGDWDGDGASSPGFFRPADTSWHFRNALSTGAEGLPVVYGGNPSDVPVAGDWNGDGIDTIGVYRPDRGEVDLEDGLQVASSGADFFVPEGAIPVVGDWGGQGFDTLAFVVDGVWHRQLTNCDCLPSNDPRTFEFGAPGDLPLAGIWAPVR